MATLVRIRNISRNRLRINKTNVSSSASGSIIDLDDAATRRDMRNNLQRYVIVGSPNLSPISARDATTDLANTNFPTTKARFTAVELPAGLKVSGVKITSGATAGATLTGTWAALWRPNTAGTTLTCLAVSPNNAAASWALDTTNTYTFGTAAVTPANDFYYFSFVQIGTTPASILGQVFPRANVQTLTAGPAKKYGVDTTTVLTTTPVAVGATVTVANIVADTAIPYLNIV